MYRYALFIDHGRLHSKIFNQVIRHLSYIVHVCTDMSRIVSFKAQFSTELTLLRFPCYPYMYFMQCFGYNPMLSGGFRVHVHVDAVYM